VGPQKGLRGARIDRCYAGAKEPTHLNIAGVLTAFVPRACGSPVAALPVLASAFEELGHCTCPRPDMELLVNVSDVGFNG